MLCKFGADDILKLVLLFFKENKIDILCNSHEMASLIFPKIYRKNIKVLSAIVVLSTLRVNSLQMEMNLVDNKRVYFSKLGPVVQSVVSLTSSLRVISLTVLVDSIYNILIFFAE